MHVHVYNTIKTFVLRTVVNCCVESESWAVADLHGGWRWLYFVGG